MRFAPFARKLRCLHTLFTKRKSVFYLITNNIFVYIIQWGNAHYFDNTLCAQRFIDCTDKKLKLKVKIEDGFNHIMN